jgi:hypothetical protein
MLWRLLEPLIRDTIVHSTNWAVLRVTLGLYPDPSCCVPKGAPLLS